MTKGPDFYDEEAVFRYYTARRQSTANPSPNDTMEKPVFMELLGDVRGKYVLDLGCGDGAYGVELIHSGATYTGIEASTRMIELAQPALEAAGGELHHTTIEAYNYPVEIYDLVISRLALHYVDGIEAIFRNVHQTLKAGGRFIFSVEHPVLTSCNRAATESGIRYDWIVDDYFDTGVREVTWMGSHVTKYHRTIEDFYLGLQRAGFEIETLREARPDAVMFTDPQLYARRKRIPLFLIMAARKVVR
jgi:SAM-dependent methyltransferase